MNNLTTIAALPQGGGCLASLPAEKNEQPKVQKAACFEYFTELDWPSIVFLDEEPGC